MNRSNRHSPSAQSSVAGLVAAAKAGDRRAFDRLVERYRPGLRALCLDRVTDFDKAEDLAQDALVQAYQRLHQLQDDAAFPTWLRQIAVNRCRRRLERPWPPTVPLDEEHCGHLTRDAFREAMRREAARELRAALAGLPENNRVALLMFYLRGDSRREIAEFLGVPESIVKEPKGI
jgi:RNA polymerase sigma-70 factor (ECF subfamily)